MIEAESWERRSTSARAEIRRVDWQAAATQKGKNNIRVDEHEQALGLFLEASEGGKGGEGESGDDDG